jgi:hypothetical protein
MGIIKSDSEVALIFSDIQSHQQGRITFSELACATFNKSFSEMCDFRDPTSVANAAAAASRAQAVQDEIDRVAAERKADEDAKAAKIEADSKKV